ncbi:MAG: glycosyltransferase family 4 protein [Candidatus Binatia bacterium]
MKVALAHKRLDRRGGTEAIFFRTAEGLRDRGHEVHLFCGEFHIAPPTGTFSHRVPYWPMGRTARLMSFAFLAPKVISQFHCDLVVSFGRMVCQDVLRSGGGSHQVFLQKMAQGCGAWKKLWYRLSPYHACVLAIERRQFRDGGYKKILAISKEVKSEIVSSCGVPPDKVVVIYNGVDLERFHPHNREKWFEEIRARWGIPLEKPVVLFVGNGFRRKGVDLLLKTWSMGRLRQMVLLLVGGDRNMPHYLRQVRSLDLAKAVIFAGKDPEVEKYYAAADLFVMPSFQEAFGNVSLEALASGLPIIIPSGSGASEILEGELTEGILQDHSSPAELETRILALLDAKRLPVLSRAARSLAERYSWDKYFTEFERQILEHPGNGR